MQAAVLRALGEPNRLRIVELLRASSFAVGDIADALGIRPPQVSKHLNVMADAGIRSEEHTSDLLSRRCVMPSLSSLATQPSAPRSGRWPASGAIFLYGNMIMPEGRDHAGSGVQCPGRAEPAEDRRAAAGQLGRGRRHR